VVSPLTLYSRLANAIQKVDVESVEFHFYSRGFERWIRDVAQSDDLADRISNLYKEGLLERNLGKSFTQQSMNGASILKNQTYQP